MNINLPTFNETYQALMQQSGLGVRDYVSTVEQAVKAYSGGTTMQADTGSEQMTKSAAGQLFRMVGLPVQVIDHFNDAPDLQVAMVQHRLAKLPDEKKAEQIICRGSVVGDNRTRIDAFLSQDYVPVSNMQLLMALREALGEIDARVHKSQIYQRQMHIRIVTPDWWHDLGGGDPAYTALSVMNDEKGKGGVTIKVAVARVACFNYVVAEEPVFEHGHRWLDQSALLNGVQEGIARLNDAAAGVAGRLRDMRDTNVNDVAGMLTTMGNEMGLPSYSVEAAKQWWTDSGAIPNLFMVVQAIAFGTDKMTSRKGFQWDRREYAEQQVFNMAKTFQETGRLELCSCPRCHRPMSVIGEDGEYINAEYSVAE